jgi:hypothetical protein
MAPRVRLLWREHRHDAGDPHLSQTLHPVKILARTERGDLDRSRIAAGFSCDLAEFRQDLGNIAAGRGNPTIAIADCAACAVREHPVRHLRSDSAVGIQTGTWRAHRGRRVLRLGHAHAAPNSWRRH